MFKRLFDPSSLFFVAALLVLLVVFQQRGLTDPGTLWHTRVGNIILIDFADPEIPAGGGYPMNDGWKITFGLEIEDDEESPGGAEA